MLKTLWIIVGAVTFGTLLEEFSLLVKLTNPMPINTSRLCCRAAVSR